MGIALHSLPALFDQFSAGAGLLELEAIAEDITAAHHRSDHDRFEPQPDLQLHGFTDQKARPATTAEIPDSLISRVRPGTSPASLRVDTHFNFQSEIVERGERPASSRVARACLLTPCNSSSTGDPALKQIEMAAFRFSDRLRNTVC